MSEPVSSTGKESLQALREGMTTTISLIVLVLTAYMLYSTFISGGTIVPVGASDEHNALVAKAQADAYARQKDIMLYALALFGTVMGYYLGRVPAEANARRAERTADAAQNQLSNTQERLVDASASASTATAETGRVKEEKAKVDAKLHTAKQALRESSATLSGTRKARSEGAKGRATAGAPEALADIEQDEALRRAQEQIDSALARIDAPTWP